MKRTPKELERARLYRQNNPDKVKAATKRWRENNREKVAKNLRAWKDANKDKVEASRQRFFANNPEYKAKYQRMWWATNKGRFLKFKITAREKGREFELTMEQWLDLVGRPCTYCGEITINKYGYGIDRVNSNLGYTLKNSVPCCIICNQMKSNLSVVNFYSHIQKIMSNTRLK